MYINTKLLKEKGYSTLHLLFLQLLNQNKIEDVSEDIAKIYDIVVQMEIDIDEFVYEIKGSSKQNIFQKMRITKKGKRFLDNALTPEVLEEDITIFKWLESFYESNDKMIGNRKRVKTGIANFRVNSNITKNNLAFLLKAFLNDEENMKYNNKLENVFYDNKNLYSRKFDLDSCRLYHYYLKREEFFNNKFQEI